MSDVRMPSPSPRTLACAAAVLALALGALALRPPAPARAAGRPNIVFVLTDDLSWDLVRFMPQVRKLQRDGLTFANYYVSDSLCCPSRASIFTGQFPHDTGVVYNTAPHGGATTFRRRGGDRHTFAVALEAAGYRTAMMGKYLNDYRPQSRYVPPGWSQWAVPGNAYREFGYTLSLDGRPVGRGWKRHDYLTDVMSRRGSLFIRQSAVDHRPFFLEVATFAPHRPSTPAPRDRHRFRFLRAPRTAAYDVLTKDGAPWQRHFKPLSAAKRRKIDREFRRRARSVLAVDRLIEHLRQVVRRRGLERNTYVVFSSDNGYHLGQHRLVAGKQTAFDTDVHVPLVVAGPGVARGATTAALAENVDLGPTFERLGGAPVPDWVDGHPLDALLHGGRPWDWRDAVLVEHHRPPRDPADPDVQPVSAGNPPTYEALRTRGGTYVEYRHGGREYYDDRADPAQTVNAYGDLSAARRDALHRALRAMATCHGRRACWKASILTGP